MFVIFGLKCISEYIKVLRLILLFHFRHSERCVCFVSDRSLYREFLFLTLAAMGKDHVGKNDATDFCCTTIWFEQKVDQVLLILNVSPELGEFQLQMKQLWDELELL